MNLDELSDVVRDALSSSRDRVQMEDVIQELAVRALAGELDVNELTSDGLEGRIRRMAKSFRVRSPSPTGYDDYKKAHAVLREYDSSLPQDWERLLIGFSDAERERMLEPARLGETDQESLAKAIGLRPRALRYRIEAIRRSAPR